MLILTVIQGPDKDRRFELPDHEPQQIGRSSEALPLADRTISRRHAELTPDDGSWILRDLQSSNGTFVNGVRVIEPRLLRNGDQIRAGTTLLVFGEDPRAQQRRLQRVKPLSREEVEVSLQHQVPSNDDSMIMSSPEPTQSAQFQLNVIYDLVNLIGNVRDKQELFERVMEVVFDHFDADRGFVLVDEQLVEPGGGATPAPAGAGVPVSPTATGGNGAPNVVPVVVRRRHDQLTGQPAPGERGPVPYSKTIVDYVLRRGVGVLTSNAMSDSRFASGDSVQGLHIHSAMCVPIRYKDRMYGVLHLDSKIANYTYTEDQLALLTAIGVQTGLALANLRLIDARLRSERLAAVGQTVASLSHSIKNILQGLRGGADVVELGLRKQNMPVVNSGWEIVGRNLERIYELTMNMLAFSKQRRPEFEMIQLNPLLEEVVALIQPQAEKRKVAVLCDFADDLPPLPLDGGGIHQAVLNLLSNALDAVEVETGVITVKTGFDAASDQTLITVADNGQGMSEATRARLFEPFHSTKGLRGTGLGLVVTQKIVREHGGTIRVDSVPDGGTTFTVELPISIGAAPSSADTHGPFTPVKA